MFAALFRYRGPLCLALLVGVNLAFAFGLLAVAGRTAEAPVLPVAAMRAIAVALGIVLGDVYLLVLWLGLAGPRAIYRYSLVGIVFLVSASTISRGLDLAHSGDGALLAAYAAVPVLAAHLPLLSLRWLLGWRLAFNANNYPVERAGRAQFYLAHCFWLTVLVAVPLALYRSLDDLFRDGEEVPAWVLAAIGLLVMVAGVSGTFVVLARERRWFPILVLFVVLLVARGGEHLLDRWYATGAVTNYCLLAAPMAGISLAVIVNLGVLRVAGLRLLVLRPPLPADPNPENPPPPAARGRTFP